MRNISGSWRATALFAVVLFAAACGSDEDQSSSNSADSTVESTAAESGGTATSTTSSASSDCAAEAKARVEAGMAPLEGEAPTPLEMSSMQGRKFAIIQLTAQSPLSQDAADGVIEALEVVGAEGLDLDGKGTPDVIAQAFQQAIAQDVAAIATIGLDPALVKAAIADAKAAGIPVVVAGASDPGSPLADGVVAHVSVDAVREGTLQADYALAATDCDLHATLVFTTAAPLTVNHANGAEAEIKALCGDECSIEKIDFNAATFATTLPGQVQTTLQRSPEINYLLASAGVMVPYLIQGRDALGSDVPIGSADGNQLVAAQTSGAKDPAFDVQWPPGQVMGWYVADSLMRASTGVGQSWELPLRLVDSTNLASGTDFAAQYPGLVDFQDDFKKAWGV